MPRKPSRRELIKWMSAGAVSAFVPVGYGDVETSWLAIERHTLNLPRWSADGFRAVLLADFHANSWHRASVCEDAIRIALAEKPDVILLAGDFLNVVYPTQLEILRHLLGLFDSATCPVYAVLGNHDYWSGEATRIKWTIEKSIVRCLMNETDRVGEVLIAGLDDALTRRHRPKILNAYTEEGSILTMLHEPDYVFSLPKHVGLMVSGHSHGGQICLPGGHALHTPSGARKYIKGFYPDADVPLYVTRGVGTTGPNWRFFCRPEVSVLTLRSANASGGTTG